MNGNQRSISITRSGYPGRLALLTSVCCLTVGLPVYAGETVALGRSTELRYNVIANYSAGVRVEQPAPEIVGTFPIRETEPNNPLSYPDPELPKLVALPYGRNADDGDKNFGKGSLITNRISLLADFDLRHKEDLKLLGLTIKDPSLFVRASFVNDFKYMKGDTDNAEWSTLNNTQGPTTFTRATQRWGSQFKFLDWYMKGSLDLSEQTRATFKVGNHSVQWGESFFFPNIAWATTRQDASKASLPGAEIKEILAPSRQISTQIDIGDKLSLLGFYKFGFQPTDLSPPGSYFSYADMIGPGAEFIVKGANPLLRVPATKQLVGLLFDKNSTFGSPVDKLYYRGDIRPGTFNDGGVGIRGRIGDAVELGLYGINYHEKVPLPVMEYGYQSLVNLPALGVPANLLLPQVTVDTLKSSGLLSDTGLLEASTRKIPVAYRLRYFDNVKVLGSSFSSNLFGVNFAGDLAYKYGVPVLVKTYDDSFYNDEFKAKNPDVPPITVPTAVRGNVIHANLNWLKLFGPNFLANRLAWVGEFSYVNLLNYDKPDGNNALAVGATKSALGFGTQMILSYPAVYEGWDLEVPISATYGLYGKSPVNGALGGITGKKDFQGSLGLSMTYLDNLQLILKYNAYLGKADVDQRPLADRDNVTFNIKYAF